MKSILFFVCFLNLIFLDKTGAANKKNPQSHRMESRKIFLDTMANPLAAELFRLDQLEKFSDPFDSSLRDFFTQDPFFSKIYQLIYQNYDLVLSDFSNSMLISSTRLEPGLTAHYDMVRKIVTDTALDLGFPQSALDKMELYVTGGSENAYTVSGLQDRIIIVFQRDLLRTLSHGELRAVIGHELGHIRAQHVVVGQANQIMLQMLGAYITQSAQSTTDQDVAEDLRRSENLFIQDVDFGHIYSEHSIHESHSKPSGQQSRIEKMNLKRKNFADQVNHLMMTFMKQSDDIKRSFFTDYLSMLIQNLENAGAFSETIRFFESLHKDFTTQKYFRPTNIEYARFHLTIALFAASQAFEMTSDRISNSVVKREYLASAMAKLLGADFDGSRRKNGFENRDERRRIIEQLMRQADEFYKNNPGDAGALDLGQMTHPNPPVRVHEIMHLEKYPAIIFADPFLRNLYLQDLLSAQRIDIEFKIKKLEQIKKEAVEIQADAKSIQKIDQYLESFKASLDMLNSVTQEYEQKILQMILNSSKGGITAPYKKSHQETVDIDGILVGSEKQVSGAPRYLALVRYLSNAIRELISKYIQLNEAQSSVEDANTKLYYKYNMQVIEAQLEQMKKFVLKVLESTSTKLQEESYSAESRNAIATRILYLEKIAALKTPKELLESLLETETALFEGKRISDVEEMSVDLFTQDFIPLRIQMQNASQKSLCQSYFN